MTHHVGRFIGGSLGAPQKHAEHDVRQVPMWGEIRGDQGRSGEIRSPA